MVLILGLGTIPAPVGSPAVPGVEVRRAVADLAAEVLAILDVVGTFAHG